MRATSALVRIREEIVSREFGVPLALSVLVHGGGVVVFAVLGTAWLVGSPPARAPAALYVNLVDPIVATSGRPEAADAPGEGLGITQSRRPAAPPEPAPGDMARPADAPAASTAAPTVAREIQAGAVAEVPRPPAPPVAFRMTDPPPDATPTAEPVSPRPSPAPLASSPMPSSPGARSSANAVAESPASDTDPAPPRAIVSSSARVPPSGLAEDRLSPSMSGSDSEGPSRGASTGELAGRSDTEPPGPTAGVVPRSGSQPGVAGGASLARAPSGEAQAMSAPDGAVPPEYESYVRSLRQRVQERLAYPWTAVRRGQQGVVELEVRVGPDGRLVAVEVVAGTTVDTLRLAAVAAVRGSAPFPFPPGLAARPLVIRLPVEFRLR